MDDYGWNRRINEQIEYRYHQGAKYRITKITDIPKIMINKKWYRGAMLLQEWFDRKADDNTPVIIRTKKKS